MRHFFGIGALLGLVLALATALAGIAGADIPDRPLAWLALLTKVEVVVALAVSVLVMRKGPRFVVPREVSAGGLLLVLVMVGAIAAPGRLPDGRPRQVDARYVVVDQHGAVLRTLSAEQYLAARRSEERVECAAMALFLYLATLALLTPARVWSPARPHRWGDLAGSAFTVRGGDVSA